MQSWYRPHPYGVYPRGNVKDVRDITHRLGDCSKLIRATAHDDKEHTELPFLELMQTIFSFMEIPELCRLSRTCTGFYVLVHCTEALKNAYTLVSPERLRFRHSWKETAVRGYLRSVGRLSVADDESPERSDSSVPIAKKARKDNANGSSSSSLSTARHPHTPIAVKRRFYCDHLFQAWMCTTLPSHYHLRPVAAESPSSRVGHSLDDMGNDVLQLGKRVRGKSAGRQTGQEDEVRGTTDAAAASSGAAAAIGHGSEAGRKHSSELSSEVERPPQYRSAFKPVPRCAGLSPEAFRERFEKPNKPVILTDIAVEWPVYKILSEKFTNLSDKKEALMRPGCSADSLLRCEYTNMSVADYVRYATEQQDERPTYLFDAEYWKVMDTDKLYQVPEHFARDDFFASMGNDRRPKFRWLIAGPARGGSSFHVDPNYTNAWNANLTGRKRWLLFPPGATPPGCVPSEDMSEVATPLSLTEWLLNFYDASVEQHRHVGYECICEPGDIMFVPCGWWHSVINLEDSVAITHNYVSSNNLAKVVKFLRAMKGSISGINEDSDDISEEATARRRQAFAEEFVSAMYAKHPAAMREAEEQIAREHEEREKKRVHHIDLLESGSEGFTFNF